MSTPSPARRALRNRLRARVARRAREAPRSTERTPRRSEDTGTRRTSARIDHRAAPFRSREPRACSAGSGSPRREAVAATRSRALPHEEPKAPTRQRQGSPRTRGSHAVAQRAQASKRRAAVDRSWGRWYAAGWAIVTLCRARWMFCDRPRGAHRCRRMGWKMPLETHVALEGRDDRLKRGVSRTGLTNPVLGAARRLTAKGALRATTVRRRSNGRRAMGNEQRATSNGQRATGNGQ